MGRDEFIIKEEILKRHNHKIWQGKDGFWYTYIDDPSKEKKKRLIRKKKENSIYEELSHEYIIDMIREDFSQYKEIFHPQLQQASYLISCKGDVYSIFEKKWLKPVIVKPNNSNKSSYDMPVVDLKCKDGKERRFYICYLVMATWGEKCPTDMEHPTIDHIDGDSTNNYYRNLRWLPRWQNSAIRKMRGIGETNNRNILKLKDVIHICNLLVKKLKTADEIAEMYGVHPSTIRKIREKKSWVYISELFEFND